MKVAALIFWLLTAGGGFILLGTWLAKGGMRRDGPGSKFPPAVIFGHFLLAAIGLILWIVHVASDSEATGWTAFGFLAVVALLGFTMFALWVPTFNAARRSAPMTSGGAASGMGTSGVATATAPATTVAEPAERHFPLMIVMGHGLGAATTLILVLLTMAGVGGS